MIPVYFTSALANHLWQSTVFAGIAGLLALALIHGAIIMREMALRH